MERPLQSLEAILQCLSVLSLCLIHAGRVESDVIVAMLAVSRRIAANVQGLATWRYSVLRKPGLVLSKDMKMKIYSIAWLYSSD